MKNILEILLSKIMMSFLYCSISFFIILTGVSLLPTLPEHTQFYYALAILGGSIYYTHKMIEMWFNNLHLAKGKKTK